MLEELHLTQCAVPGSIPGCSTNKFLWGSSSAVERDFLHFCRRSFDCLAGECRWEYMVIAGSTPALIRFQTTDQEISRHFCRQLKWIGLKEN